jgi:hypothetical protein
VRGQARREDGEWHRREGRLRNNCIMRLFINYTEIMWRKNAKLSLHLRVEAYFTCLLTLAAGEGALKSPRVGWARHVARAGRRNA